MARGRTTTQPSRFWDACLHGIPEDETLGIASLARKVLSRLSQRDGTTDRSLSDLAGLFSDQDFAAGAHGPFGTILNLIYGDSKTGAGESPEGLVYDPIESVSWLNEVSTASAERATQAQQLAGVKLEPYSPEELESASPDKLESDSADKLEPASPDKLETASRYKLELDSPDKLEPDSPDKLETAPRYKLELDSPDKLEPDSPDKLETASPDKLESASPDKLESASPDKLESASADPLEPAPPDNDNKNSQRAGIGSLGSAAPPSAVGPETTIRDSPAPDSSCESSDSCSAQGPHQHVRWKATGWAAKCDWDRHRTTITRLYIHENLTLKQVMEFMKENEGLHATARMYKTAMVKWGVHKNVTRRSFKSVTSKGLTASRVKRLVDKNGAIWFMNQRAEMLRRIADTQDVAAKDGRVSWEMAVPMIRTLSPPLQQVEEILRATRTYFEGHLDTYTWQHDLGCTPKEGDATNTCFHMAIYQNCFQSGFLDLATPPVAFQLFDISFEGFGHILRCHAPTLLPGLIWSTTRVQSDPGVRSTAELLDMLFKFLANLAGVLMGVGHPLRKILEIIPLVRRTEHEQAMFRQLLSCMVDTLERRLDPASHSIGMLLLCKAGVDLWTSPCEPTDYDHYHGLLRGRLSSLSPGPHSELVELDIHYGLANSLHASGHWAEAEASILYVLRRTEISTAYAVNGLVILGVIARDSGKLERAARAFGIALLVASEMANRGSPAGQAAAILSLNNLVDALRPWENSSFYAQASAWRQDVLSAIKSPWSEILRF